MNFYIVISVVTISLLETRVLCKCKSEFCWSYDSSLAALKINRVNLGFLARRHVKRYPEAKSIIADYANIIDILPRTFRKSKYVNTISVTNNRIRQLGNYTFDGCVELKIIYLSGNEIRKISPNAFRTKNPSDQFHLESLSLSNNRIRKLQSAVFDACCFKSLKHFDISANPRLQRGDLLKNFELLDWAKFRDKVLEFHDYGVSDSEEDLIDSTIMLFKNHTILESFDDD